MKKIFRVIPERCVACGKCELACAFAHGAGGVPAVSRIRIYRRGPEAGVPVVCLQCDHAACSAACPVGAIEWNTRTAALEINREKCVNCHLCVAACPFGNMVRDNRDFTVAKCDLCDGNPQCVTFCPTGAIEYVASDLAAKTPAPASR